MNYFILFDLPETYEIDSDRLSARFQALQRQYHPDRFASRPAAERLQAVQQAATINQGYQALRQPLARAEYLLSLHGFDINNEQHTLRDGEFLMEQLILREELENLEQRSDGEALSAFIPRVIAMERPYVQQLKQQLADAQWERAADTVRKLRFLAKLRGQAEQLEENLFDL